MFSRLLIIPGASKPEFCDPVSVSISSCYLELLSTAVVYTAEAGLEDDGATGSLPPSPSSLTPASPSVPLPGHKR
ncbi:hypothetical protein Pmani_019018 [Petrolisthes manimaculis]|uniref:Uncharacterized protein n=1 Tax=Petrolisthes manimaculis TaxID=1843537 RepID=A0AAE1PJ51_9EUCA|nr:hypothetical protein Pmani_019018 [Petrolisthes manimaculis]